MSRNWLNWSICFYKPHFGAMDKAPTISREDHSSYCFAQSEAAPVLENFLEIWSKTAEENRTAPAVLRTSSQSMGRIQFGPYLPAA
ncbi:hypothetical protein NCCP2050_23140 [Planococcus sp. NCCP-2050]|nr:hypothetical protein NCCP2050_23140 [Planococcus sp. NCCP-2050]